MSRLPVFRAEFRRVGTLDAQPVYRVAESAEHAERLLRAEISKRLRGADFELSEVVECLDKDLPNSEKLFEQLQRQRAKLSPESETKSTGPFFAFFVSTNGSKPRRVWAYSTAGELSARAKVERRLQYKQISSELKADLREESEPPETKLTGRVDRHELTDVLQIVGARQSSVFGALVPDDIREFVGDLETEHRESVLEYLAGETKRIQNSETVPVLRTPPKLPALLVDGRAVVKGFDGSADVAEGVPSASTAREFAGA